MNGKFKELLTVIMIVLSLVGIVGCTEDNSTTENSTEDLPNELTLPKSDSRFKKQTEKLEKELKEELANNIAERENVELDWDLQTDFNQAKKIKDIQASINDDPLNYYEIIIRFIEDECIHEYFLYRSENASYSFTANSLKDIYHVEYARYRFIQDGEVTIETITPEYVDIAGKNGWGENAIDKDTSKIYNLFNNDMCRLYNKD